MNLPQGTSPESDGSSVPGLLTRLKTPVESDWHRLLTLYGPVVLFWCRLRGLQSDRIADVFAAVFRAVAVGITEIEEQLSLGSFRNWIRTITQKIVDETLNDGTAGPTDVAAAALAGEAPANALPELVAQQGSAAEDVLLMRQALDLVRSEFDAVTFDAFAKSTLERQPVATVASNLCIPPHKVRVARSRVLHRLREEFGPLLD